MDNSPSATRKPKQARAIRTRERILDQAERAFAAKGFEAASLTSDILDPAGISVGSFYHQFSDKRAVLYALLEERRGARLARALEVANAPELTSFNQSVRQAVLELLDDIDRYPDTWWIHFREIHNADPEIREIVARSWAMWLDSIRSILERWVPSPGARTPGRALFATYGVTGILRLYLDADEAMRRRIRDEMVDDAVAGCTASFSDCLSPA